MPEPAGADNDGDFAVDMNDLGCGDLDDDTENSNSPSESTVFFDAFEPLALIAPIVVESEANALQAPTVAPWVFDPGSLWHVGADCVTPWLPNSPNHLSWTGGSCTYDTGARVQGAATLATPVNLAQKSQATLEIHHRFEIGGALEQLRVQASADGVSWTTVRLYVSQDTDSTAWAVARADLDAYARGPLLLRFHADTGDALDNAHQGWFIDAVRVTAA